MFGRLQGGRHDEAQARRDRKGPLGNLANLAILPTVARGPAE